MNKKEDLQHKPHLDTWHRLCNIFRMIVVLDSNIAAKFVISYKKCPRILNKERKWVNCVTAKFVPSLRIFDAVS